MSDAQDIADAWAARALELIERDDRDRRRSAFFQAYMRGEVTLAEDRPRAGPAPSGAPCAAIAPTP